MLTSLLRKEVKTLCFYRLFVYILILSLCISSRKGNFVFYILLKFERLFLLKT